MNHHALELSLRAHETGADFHSAGLRYYEALSCGYTATTAEALEECLMCGALHSEAIDNLITYLRTLPPEERIIGAMTAGGRLLTAEQERATLEASRERLRAYARRRSTIARNRVRMPMAAPEVGRNEFP